MKHFTRKQFYHFSGGVVTASALSLFLAAAPVSAQMGTEEGAAAQPDTGAMGGETGMQSGQMGEGEAPRVDFSQLDTDGDGQLSRDEAHAAINPEVGSEEYDQRFSSADQNQDGVLDQTEFSAFEQQGGLISPQDQVSPGVMDQGAPGTESPGMEQSPGMDQPPTEE